MSSCHQSTALAKNKMLCSQASLFLAVCLSCREESQRMVECGEMLNGSDERRPSHKGTGKNQVQSKLILHSRMVKKIATKPHVAHTWVVALHTCRASCVFARTPLHNLIFDNTQILEHAMCNVWFCCDLGCKPWIQNQFALNLILPNPFARQLAFIKSVEHFSAFSCPSGFLLV